MSGRSVRSRCAHLFNDLLGDRELIGQAAAAQAEWQRDSVDAYCPRCGATMAAEAITATGCGPCRERELPWQRVVRLGAYREPMRSWIIRMKFGGTWGWAEWFGEQLAASLATAQMPPADYLVPVPLHWMRTIRRGFDQSRVMAEACGRGLGVDVARVLRRRRRTRPQSRIAAKQHRWENVRDAFAIRPIDLAGKHVLVIDDVTTTGATARACMRLLREAGAGRIDLAVAAVVDPHDGPATGV